MGIHSRLPLSFLLLVSSFFVRTAVDGLPQEKCRGKCTEESCGPCEKIDLDTTQANLLLSDGTIIAHSTGSHVVQQPELTPTPRPSFTGGTNPPVSTSRHPALSGPLEMVARLSMFTGTDGGNLPPEPAPADSGSTDSRSGASFAVATSTSTGNVSDVSSMSNDTEAQAGYFVDGVSGWTSPMQDLDNKSPAGSSLNYKVPVELLPTLDKMTVSTTFKAKRTVTPTVTAADKTIVPEFTNVNPSNLENNSQTDWQNLFGLSKDSVHGNNTDDQPPTSTKPSESGLFSIYSAIPAHDGDLNGTQSPPASEAGSGVTAEPASRQNVTDGVVLPDESKRRDTGPILVGALPKVPTLNDTALEGLDVSKNQGSSSSSPAPGTDFGMNNTLTRPADSVTGWPKLLPTWPSGDGDDDGGDGGGHRDEGGDNDTQMDTLQIICLVAPCVGALLAFTGAIFVIRFAVVNRRLRKKLQSSVQNGHLGEERQKQQQPQQQRHQQPQQQEQTVQHQQKMLKQQQRRRSSASSQIRYENEINGQHPPAVHKYKLNKRFSQTSRNGLRPAA